MERVQKKCRLTSERRGNNLESGEFLLNFAVNLRDKRREEARNKEKVRDMKHRFATLLAGFFVLFAVASCGGSPSAAVALKISNGEQLDGSDYDVMIGYVGEATEVLVPRLREAKTFEDVEALDADIMKEFPHLDDFNSALLRAYPDLTDKQKENLHEFTQRSRDAFDEK